MKKILDYAGIAFCYAFGIWVVCALAFEIYVLVRYIM